MKEHLVTQQSIDMHAVAHSSRRHDYPNENIVRLVGSFFQGQRFGKVEVDRSSDNKGRLLDYGCADGNNSKFLPPCIKNLRAYIFSLMFLKILMKLHGLQNFFHKSVLILKFITNSIC